MYFNPTQPTLHELTHDSFIYLLVPDGVGHQSFSENPWIGGACGDDLAACFDLTARVRVGIE
jgi:hypothetical protein